MAFRARYGSLGGANDFVDGFAAVRLFLAETPTRGRESRFA